MTVKHVSPQGTTLQITVGDEAFRFMSEAEWVNKAKSWFKHTGLREGNCVCIDAKGRICTRGEHFMRAEREGTYPIVVYPIDVHGED